MPGDNRAGDLAAVRTLMDRLRTIQMGAASRFVIAFDEGGCHIREVIETYHKPAYDTASHRREVHYQTYPVASGASIAEAVANARAVNWSSERQ